MNDEEFREVRIPSRMSEGRRVVEEFVTWIESWGVTHDESLALRHSLHEAIVNAVRHGNGGDHDRQVRVCYSVCNDEIRIEVEDEGPGFNRSLVADPRTDENRCRPGGRGLMMMRHFMNSVEHNDRGNCVTMRRICERR